MKIDVSISPLLVEMEGLMQTTPEEEGMWLLVSHTERGVEEQAPSH